MGIDNIIITSHSKRIRKFIDDYFDNFNRNKRFMNCAILLLKSDPDNPIMINIKLIYNGESDPRENRDLRNYYNTGEFNSLNLKSTTLIIPEGLNIFLIRHAQGYHNLNNTIIKKIKALDDKHILKDPQLTDLGKIQASNAGKFLYLNYNYVKNNSIYFCSILLRTRETISLILDEFNLLNQEIIVLPQSHEISNFIIPESFVLNNGQCINKSTNRILYKCDFTTSKDSKNGIYKFNWNYFSKIKSNKLKLTNMLYEAYIIYAMILQKDNNYIDWLRKKLIKL